MPQDFTDETENDAAPPAPVAAAEPERKVLGVQIGEIVEQQAASGGEYEALGGGKFRRIG